MAGADRIWCYALTLILLCVVVFSARMPFYLSGAVHYLLKGTWTPDDALGIGHPRNLNLGHKENPLNKFNAMYKGRKDGEL